MAEEKPTRHAPSPIDELNRTPQTLDEAEAIPGRQVPPTSARTHPLDLAVPATKPKRQTRRRTRQTCSGRTLAVFSGVRLAAVRFAADVTFTTTAFLYFVVLFAHIDLYKTSQPPIGWSRIMRRAALWFNTLLVCLVLTSVPRARAADEPSEGKPETKPKSSKKEKKPKLIESIRVYVETKHDIEERSLPAVVGRSSPMSFMVEKLPILNEVHVEGATLLDQPGSFQVQIKFNTLGAKILESYTAAAAGRHLLIMTEIDKQGRWIAAPLIRKRLGDGRLTFTPDASRDEMDRLVKGLNKMVERNRKQWLN